MIFINNNQIKIELKNNFLRNQKLKFFLILSQVQKSGKMKKN